VAPNDTQWMIDHDVSRGRSVIDGRHMVEAFSLREIPEKAWADGLAVFGVLRGPFRVAELQATVGA
jgi:hypothetical protein